jgi:hypothetical protein
MIFHSSLEIQAFNILVDELYDEIPRILINREEVKTYDEKTGEGFHSNPSN